MVDIDANTRDMGLSLREHWLNRILPSDEKPEEELRSVSTANRSIGILRKIYREYYKHIGQADRLNPFRDLRFSEKHHSKKIRPPFSVSWVTGKILVPGALAGMNEEQRGILLALIETGARPIELCNLTAADIVIDDAIPHIHIRPSSEPENKHELKTEWSERDVPLVGLALEVFRKFPQGFPRYRDNSNSFSAAANKYLEENGLL